MDSKSPYLDAIQRIPGNTPKEKYKALNEIVHQIIENKEAPGDFALQIFNGSPIPEVLVPLIKIEIAIILKNTDDVIAALKSDDAVIVNRALQAVWVFDGSNKSVTNFQYFAKNIFPEVSLNTRMKIIKRLTRHLGHRNEYTVAEEFFAGVAKMYTVKIAMPFFSACSESYLFGLIRDGNVRLPRKIVMRLFVKYPELVIAYLQFIKPYFSKRKVTSDDLDLLPKLVKKFSYYFIDIIGSFDRPLDFELGNKRSELFLKSKGTEDLVKFPKKFLPLLSLKAVSTKLNKTQFELMYRNLFPTKLKDFSPNQMLEYLKFQPEEVKSSLITKTFKDAYGTNLVDTLNDIPSELMLLLSVEERVYVVKKKLDSGADPDEIEDESLICFLPTADSIPRIKNQISNTAEMEDRAVLIGELIYTCKVNNSKEDLLCVLQYISTRHRNEICTFWLKVYSYLLKYFDLELLSVDHWTILTEMIQRSYVKDQFRNDSTIGEMLLEKAVHYDLLNSLPIEDRMKLLAELKIQEWNSKFNILCAYPKYEKLCLETFIDIIPRKFPEECQIWEDGNKLDTIHYLLRGLCEYNERITKAARKHQKDVKSEELLSIRNYHWLFENVKNFALKNEEHRFGYKVSELKRYLQIHDPKLYESWMPSKETIVQVYEQKAINLLKKEPEKVLEHWKEYLKSCRKNISNGHVRIFLQKCIWYSEIPIKFLEESLSNLDDDNYIMILAYLLRGLEFTRIIEPWVPVSDKIEIYGENAVHSYGIVRCIPQAMNKVNPPPPLELASKFLQGDYLSLGLACLMSVARRVPLNKVIAFAKSLVDRPVSVKKHGIRLMFVIGSTPDTCEFLNILWNTEKHKSIREVIFQKGHKLFMNEPCETTWLLMSSFMKGLTTQEIETFNLLTKLDNIPNEYIKDYFQTALSTAEKLAENGLKLQVAKGLISTLIAKANVNVCSHFPEDYCQLLVQKFTFNWELDDEILNAGRSYTVNSYLLGAKEKLESRLKFFCNLLNTTIRETWEISHPKNFRFYPTRKIFHDIVSDIIEADCNRKGVIDLKIYKALMNTFHSVLEPIKDPVSFITLFFAIQFIEAELDGRRFGLLIEENLPHILNFFCPEIITDIAEILLNFIISCTRKTSKEVTLIESLTQTLAEKKSIHSSIIAAKLLNEHHDVFSDNIYKDIVENLKKVNHPLVISNLNKHSASLSLHQHFELYKQRNSLKAKLRLLA